MNVKIVLTATAFAGTLALAAPTLALAAPNLAQSKGAAYQIMAAPEHHNGVLLARNARNHMTRGTNMPGRRHGSARDVDAKEREETMRLNQEQLHNPGAPPAPHKSM
jgi:hypothetical protein